MERLHEVFCLVIMNVNVLHDYAPQNVFFQALNRPTLKTSFRPGALPRTPLGSLRRSLGWGGRGTLLPYPSRRLWPRFLVPANKVPGYALCTIIRRVCYSLHRVSVDC